MSIAWERGGYTVLSWRVFRVDPITWADAELVTKVSGMTVARDWSDSSPTIERGSFIVDKAVGETFEEGYYRIAMTADQGGVAERVNVATLLCASTSDTIERGVSAVEVEGRSVLYPASTAKMDVGSYAPMGVNGAEWAARMLRSCVNAPVIVTGGFILEDHVVYDVGASVLDAVWLVLRAGNHLLRILGDGTIVVAALPTEPTLPLDLAHARLLRPGIKRSLDLSEVPNRYIAIDGPRRAMAVNSDPESETSTVRRGWHSDVVDTSPVRVNGETLDSYCSRRLEEESTVEDARSYTREWWPDALPGDLARGTLNGCGLEGDFRIRSQQLTCDKGITVEEESVREVRTWQMS